jgi:hypothetical protein
MDVFCASHICSRWSLNSKSWRDVQITRHTEDDSHFKDQAIRDQNNIRFVRLHPLEGGERRDWLRLIRKFI